MKNKGYLGLLGIPIAVLGIVGSVAFAQSNTPQSTPATAQTERQEPADKEVADQTEQANTLELQAKAKITADTAVQTALQTHPGQLRETKLETDDGPLVYSVMILNGIKQYEVRVDAISGKILSDKLDEADYRNDLNEKDGNDSEETN